MNHEPLIVRPRRLRRTRVLRESVAEVSLGARALVMPHFVLPERRARVEIPSMPGIARLGQLDLVEQVRRDFELGLRTVLLFGVEERKDARGTHAADERGAVPSAVRALKDALGDELTVVTDVCLCGYTDHGHCGLVKGQVIQNDETLPHLAAMALGHAAAGADVVAPSDMMDGRVGYLRKALDEAGYSDRALLSYSTKFASAFYGPFRQAADSAPKQGDRRSYQLDHRNSREALRESLLDEAEGADLLMVKPALAYLDVLRQIRERTLVPLAAYNVSGEYSMVKASAAQGWVDEGAVVREILHAIRRAGADWIISYHAREALEKGWLA